MKLQQADVYTDFSALAKLKNQAKQESPEALKQVARQFESIFLNMVLKNMRDAKLSDGIFDSDQSEFFQEMYDQQLALELSGEPGIGLAELIVKQLSPEQKMTENRTLDDYFKNPVAITEPVAVDPVLTQAQKTEVTEEKKPAAPVVKPINIPAKIKTDKELPINTVDQFVKQLKPLADKAGQALGVDGRVLLAQAALETGWGKSVIKQKAGDSSHNLFNIKADKAWKGKKADAGTLEYVKGTMKKTVAGFRAYDSYQASFSDYVDFLKSNPRYTEALKNTANPEKFVKSLQDAGYATDPNYAQKIMSIFNSQLIGDETVVAMQ